MSEEKKDNSEVKHAHTESKEHKKEHEHKSDHKEHKAEHKTSEKHNKKKGNEVLFYQVLSGILAILLIAAIFTQGFTGYGKKISDIKGVLSQDSELAGKLTEITNILSPAKQETKEYTGDKAEVQFYIMSKCPYGVQVVDAIAPAIKELEQYVDFKVDYIATENADGSFNSLHGQTEVEGNILELCAIKYEPTKYLDLFTCMNEQYTNIPTNFDACAQKTGIDTEKVKECASSDEGKALLSASAEKAAQAQAMGSPTIYIDGQLYQSGRATTDFERAICSVIGDVPECEGIPVCSADYDCTEQADKIGSCVNPNEKDAYCEYKDPVKLEAIILTDSLCADCTDSANELAGILKEGYFKGLSTRVVDYDNGGKELMEKLGITTLPTFVFDLKIEETQAWKLAGAQFQSAFQKSGNYYFIIPAAMAASYNPKVEICDNNKDDRDQDGLIDCEDDECSSQLICREKTEKELQVFVMSQCPYGIRGLNAMKQVLDNFGNDIKFDVHYIASENADGSFNSLHGQGEVEENIRQLCVKEKLGFDTFMDYIWCRNADIAGDWKSCVEGLDQATIESCSTGTEGKKLLSEDLKVAQSLNIGASPTWLVNNIKTFSGIDSETIKTNYCAANPNLSGCSNTLSTDTQGAPAGGSC
ncbi:thioredoxin domain-containing protein [Candidatus Woesearchaeota archaeon]|nr:thioredoxin domain-containing protein [Candidatus Woesearchaeota archaeon]